MGEYLEVIGDLAFGEVFHQSEAQIKEVNRQPGDGEQDHHGSNHFGHFLSSAGNCSATSHYRFS